MRTLQNLLKTKGNINVYLSSKAVCDLFLRNAEQEGFVFSNGSRPTTSSYNDLFALHHDFTIAHHGFAGHIALRAKGISTAVPTIWIDYAKYLAGERRYVIKRTKPARRFAVSGRCGR